MELFENYFVKLHRFATGMVFDGEVANDIVQGAFIKLYEYAARLAPNTNLGGWLFVCVRNDALKHLRNRKIEDKNKLLYVQTTMDSDALEWIDDSELIKKIHEAISELPERCRQVAELRFLKSKKYKEIALELNISEDTAKVQAHRAIIKIKEKVKGNDLLLMALASFLETFI
jgi:RNA polymerase sigma-70 factor (ECF subfamily)